MVLLTIDSMVERVIKESRLEEIEFFNERWQWLKGKLDAHPDATFDYEKHGLSFFVRAMTESGVERTMTGHVINHPGIMDKKWRYEDRVVENSQGGTTELKGWILTY